MRFLLVLAAALVGITSSASATPLFTTLDQPNDVVDVNADEAGYPQRLAQAFIPAVSGTARSVSVYGQTRFQTGSSTVVLAIRADNNGNPGTLLGKGTAPIDEVTGPSPSCAELDTAAPLVAGQTYYVTFGPNGGGASWKFQRQAYKQVQKSYDVDGGWDQNSGGPQKTMSMHIDDAGCGPELRTNPVAGTTLGDMFAQNGGTASQTLVLHNDGPQALQVQSAGFAGPNAGKFDVYRGEPGSIDGQPYNFPQTIGSGSEALTILYIVCIGEGADGLRTATLNVNTNDADEPSVLFPVECLVDSTPPSLAFTQVPDGLSGWWVTKPAPLTVQGVDPESGGRVIFETCYDDNGPQQINDSGPTGVFEYTAEGVHNLACWARDVAKNRSIDLPATVKIDTQAPTTQPLTGPDELSADNDPAFVFEGADATSGLLEIQCRLDTAAFAPCTSPVARTDVPDGAHTFEVRARDKAGNLDASPGRFPFAVDTTAPDSTITSGPPAVTRENVGTFEYSATDAIAGVDHLECSFDDEPFFECTTPYVATDRGDGIHNLRIRGVDNLGNVEGTPARRQWGIDNVPPKSAFTAKPEASMTGPDTSFAFEGVELGAAGVASWTCTLDGAAYTPCTSPVALTGLEPARDHTFSVVATDVVGQVQTAPTSYTWTITDDPLARPDSATTTAGMPVDIDVLANDFVPVSGAPSVETFDAASVSGGTVSAVEGKLRFTPAS
ncbi:MAG: large repetitive protein, partial [Frankiaceae bacterium]|nr:large repetitive protein [Frankiaceae bacterium]